MRIPEARVDTAQLFYKNNYQDKGNNPFSQTKAFERRYFQYQQYT